MDDLVMILEQSIHSATTPFIFIKKELLHNNKVPLCIIQVTHRQFEKQAFWLVKSKLS